MRGLSLWLGAESAEFPQIGSGKFLWRDQSGRQHHAAEFLSGPDARLPAPSDQRASGALISPRHRRRSILAGGNLRRGLAYSAQRPRAGEGRRSRGNCLLSIPAGVGRFSGTLAELLVYDHDCWAAKRRSCSGYFNFRFSESSDPRLFENGG